MNNITTILDDKKDRKIKEETTKLESLTQLQTPRNVGVATAERLYSIGIRTPEQLKKSDPKELYELSKMMVS